MVLVQSKPLSEPYPHPPVGIISGKTPLGCCSSRWSANHFSYTVIPSKLYNADSIAKWASPVHPFFSLCGQSVGYPTKLERYELLVALHKRLIKESEV